MTTVKLRLTIEVEYDPGTTATHTLKGRLFDLADFAAGEGLMTGEPMPRWFLGTPTWMRSRT